MCLYIYIFIYSMCVCGVCLCKDTVHGPFGHIAQQHVLPPLQRAPHSPSTMVLCVSWGHAVWTLWSHFPWQLKWIRPWHLDYAAMLCASLCPASALICAASVVVWTPENYPTAPWLDEGALTLTRWGLTGFHLTDQLAAIKRSVVLVLDVWVFKRNH